MQTIRRVGLAVNTSRFGKGLFTQQDISAGQTILKIKGRKLSFNETLTLGEKECYCLQTGFQQYIIPDYPFYYSNHSCHPNCGITRSLELISLVPISQGEELVWDYSTSMLERNWTMECQCGSPFCRGLITDFDLLPPSVQRKYLEEEIVLSFIEEYMQSSSYVNLDMHLMRPAF
jgi:hypothetical protein